MHVSCRGLQVLVHGSGRFTRSTSVVRALMDRKCVAKRLGSDFSTTGVISPSGFIDLLCCFNVLAVDKVRRKGGGLAVPGRMIRRRLCACLLGACGRTSLDFDDCRGSRLTDGLTCQKS